MSLRIAIHPDDYGGPDGRPDASSPRWTAAIQAAGHTVKPVDVRRPDIIDQLRDCDGFMWRWAHFGGMHRIARRLFPVVERELGIPVYPDQNTAWHFDDKLAQNYLFRALGIPCPETWAWFDRDAALQWAEGAAYPVVLKLAAGAGSRNVRLVRSADEARGWIDALFDRGAYTLDDDQVHPWPPARRLKSAGRLMLTGRPPRSLLRDEELQRGYVLFQEFVPGNAGDTRITVVGRRAFGYRRFNRPGDFRASGSGNFDPNPDAIDLALVRFAFDAARRLRSQSAAFDLLVRGNEPVVGEVSYAYVSWMVQACPGHWELAGDPADGTIAWIPGAMWPEDAQVADFLQRLQDRR